MPGCLAGLALAACLPLAAGLRRQPALDVSRSKIASSCCDSQFARCQPPGKARMAAATVVISWRSSSWRAAPSRFCCRNAQRLQEMIGVGRRVALCETLQKHDSPIRALVE